jgi:ABC-type spermidine/putrescine transport system permease subunit I
MQQQTPVPTKRYRKTPWLAQKWEDVSFPFCNPLREMFCVVFLVCLVLALVSCSVTVFSAFVCTYVLVLLSPRVRSIIMLCECLIANYRDNGALERRYRQESGWYP